MVLFKNYIQFGSSHLHDVLRRTKRGNAKVTFAEVLDSIARKANVYYQSQDSELVNLFSLRADGFYSHFTQIYLLKYLERRFPSHSDRGYVGVDELWNKFSAIFVTKEKLTNVLESLLVQNLIDSDIGARKSFSHTKAVAISQSGKYYIHVLLHDWRYLQYVMIDTPLKDLAVHEQITSKYKPLLGWKNKKTKTRQVMECIELFLDYLKREEAQDREFIQEVAHGSFPVTPIMEDVYQEFCKLRAEELKFSTVTATKM